MPWAVVKRSATVDCVDASQAEFQEAWEASVRVDRGSQANATRLRGMQGQAVDMSNQKTRTMRRKSSPQTSMDAIHSRAVGARVRHGQRVPDASAGVHPYSLTEDAYETQRAITSSTPPLSNPHCWLITPATLRLNNQSLSDLAAAAA